MEFVNVSLLAGGALAQTSDLLISEYVEGSSNNKALEIFNGTEDVVDLGAYTIERYTNGSTTSVSIPLAAVSLGAGETWVITHNLAAAELLALAAIQEGKFAQAFPSFGPERRGAPATSPPSSRLASNTGPPPVFFFCCSRFSAPT